MSNRDIKAEIEVVKAYADEFGHEEVDTFLAEAEKRSSWLNWTWPERLEKHYGPLTQKTSGEGARR